MLLKSVLNLSLLDVTNKKVFHTMSTYLYCSVIRKVRQKGIINEWVSF